MITIGSFKDISDEYDEIWLIVRSLKNEPYVPNTKVLHVPQLSPSPELFNAYLAWRNAGEWNEDTFETKYVPQFLHEMHEQTARNTLSYLYKLSMDKNILLACYCRDESLCHRSIVFGIIQGRAMELKDRIKCCGEDFMADDYSDYYNQYKKLDNKFVSNIQASHWKQETIFYMLVAGSRGFDNYPLMCKCLDFLLKKQVAMNKHIVIVSGGAKGADSLAERYADERGYEKHIMPADWDKHGKSAGYRRNESMHLFISAPSGKKRGCICFWDGQSKGTRHNFKLAKDYGTPIRVYDYVRNRFLTDNEVEQHS